jgi:hypothetical protein
MKKQHIKYIKELAIRLPVVYQQSISGFYNEIGDDGNVVFKPNVFNSEINHVRRMRKAYENLGMEGIKGYLEMIHKIQIQRNELVQNELLSKNQETPLDSVVSSIESGSNIDSAEVTNTVQDSVGVSGGTGEKRKRTRRTDKQTSEGVKEI